MNRSESKYFATAQKMDEAFLSLLEKKDFAYITVKEICACAGVNRSTFYLHYETIGDLLAESTAYVERFFYSHFDDSGHLAERLADCPTEELYLATPTYLCPYLRFVREHRQLYRTVLDNPGVFRSMESYEKLFARIFDPILARFSIPEAERKYRMAFYLSGIQAVVAQWLRSGCKESDEALAALIERCVTGNHHSVPSVSDGQL